MIAEDKRIIRLEHGYYGFDMTISPKDMDLEDLSILFKIIGLWISFTPQQLDDVINNVEEKVLTPEYIYKFLETAHEKNN
jgi:hypothetical protein